MKRSRFSEEQTIGTLWEQEAGAATADVGREHGINIATFYKWKGKFGGMAGRSRSRWTGENTIASSESGLEAKRVKSGECSNSIALQSFRHVCFEEQQKRADEYQPSTSNRCREKLPCTSNVNASI